MTNGWYAQFDSMGKVYERIQTQSTQAWQTEDHEVSE